MLKLTVLFCALCLFCACAARAPRPAPPPVVATRPLSCRVCRTGPAGPADSESSQERSFSGATEPADATPQDAPSIEQQPSFVVTHPLPENVAERITGVSWTPESPLALDQLAYLSLSYRDFEGKLQQGEMIAHVALAQDLAEIFEELYCAGFPIARMELIEAYGGDDNHSMEANNTYAFCTRPIAGTNYYSLHSYGIALDINPVQNPYLREKLVEPEAGTDYLVRDDIRPGMIVAGDVCHSAFTSRGWSWGGSWKLPDYQHFEKRLS